MLGAITIPRGQGIRYLVFMSHSHTVVENNGLFYLYGGADSETRTNDLFVFSIGILKIFVLYSGTIVKKQWFKLNPKGDKQPIARSGAQSLSY